MVVRSVGCESSCNGPILCVCQNLWIMTFRPSDEELIVGAGLAEAEEFDRDWRAG